MERELIVIKNPRLVTWYEEFDYVTTDSGFIAYKAIKENKALNLKILLDKFILEVEKKFAMDEVFILSANDIVYDVPDNIVLNRNEKIYKMIDKNKRAIDIERVHEFSKEEIANETFCIILYDTDPDYNLYFSDMVLFKAKVTERGIKK